MSDDAIYYGERALTQRELARAAKDERVKAIHDELARQCDRLAQEAESGPLPQKPDRVVHDLPPGNSRWHSDWNSL